MTRTETCIFVFFLTVVAVISTVQTIHWLIQ
jgi:hypothetical protein